MPQTVAVQPFLPGVNNLVGKAMSQSEADYSYIPRRPVEN